MMAKKGGCKWPSSGIPCCSTACIVSAAWKASTHTRHYRQGRHAPAVSQREHAQRINHDCTHAPVPKAHEGAHWRAPAPSAAASAPAVYGASSCSFDVLQGWFGMQSIGERNRMATQERHSLSRSVRPHKSAAAQALRKRAAGRLCVSTKSAGAELHIEGSSMKLCWI